MPLIPKADQLRKGAPSVSSGVVSVRAGQVEGAQAQAHMQDAQHAMQFGESISGLAELAYKHEQRLNKIKLDDFESKLMLGRAGLESGKNGYKKKRQGKVLTPDFLSKVESDYDKLVDDLSDQLLTNDTQREEARRISESYKSKHLIGALNHIDRETSAYEETVYNNQMLAFSNHAVMNYDNPDMVSSASEGIKAATLNRLHQLGITDVTSVEETLKSQLGPMHAAVISASLQDGSIQYANDYYSAVRGQMPADTARKVEKMLNTSNNFAIGDAVGQKAFQMMESGASSVEVQKFINTNATDKESRQIAKATVGALEQAKKKDVENTIGDVTLKFYAGGMNEAGLIAAVRSPEFMGLESAEQAKVLKDMTSAMQREREVLSQEQKRGLKIQAYERIGTMSPDELASINDRHIAVFARDFGPENANILKAAANAAKAEGRRAKLDPDLLKAAMLDMKAATKKNKAKFEAIAQGQLMDWQTDHPGTQPSVEVQKSLINSAKEMWIDSTSWFLREKELAKYDEELVKANKIFPKVFRSIFPDLEDEDIQIRFNDLAGTYDNFYTDFLSLYASARDTALQQGEEPPEKEDALKAYLENLLSK